jgi:hypothetical protein
MMFSVYQLGRGALEAPGAKILAAGAEKARAAEGKAYQNFGECGSRGRRGRELNQDLPRSGRP